MIGFIFGDDACVSVIQYAREPMPRQYNVNTMQGHKSLNETTNTGVQNCTILTASDLQHDLNSTTKYLGMLWGDYPMMAFLQSDMRELANPVGWIAWDNKTFMINTLFYGKFQNYGIVANTSQRVKWSGFSRMNESEALNFTINKFPTGKHGCHSPFFLYI